MKKCFGILVFLLATAYSATAQLQFSEEASNLGCGNSSYGIGDLGAGITFFDFDGDGWDDLTVPSEVGLPVRFFKNNEGKFSEVNLNINNFYGVKSVQWVDFDNDGDYDLFVTSNETGTNVLYGNDGSMNFTNVTIAAGLLTWGHHTYGGSWGDYNNDGWLDLFICSRTNFILPQPTLANLLFANNGDGTFTNVSAAAGISPDHHRSFCSAFFDYNNDGWQDIVIANDRIDTENQLYRNNTDGTFTEIGSSANMNFVMNAMSTTIGDYNQDGWFDVYTTNTYEGNVFSRNNGDGTFTDVAASNGTLMESVAWGSVFLDAENDGDIDLYVSSMIPDNTNSLSSAFYENNGANQYTIPSGIGFENDLARSYGNAIGDINNDGLPDIAVLNLAPDDIYIWENQSNTTNNWLKVKLEGVVSNRMGIGSWVEISVNGVKQYNYTLCGEGYLGQNSSYEFFGIGNATQIDYLKVTWLSGIVDYIENPEINEHHIIIEGSNNLNVDEPNAGINSVMLYPNPAGDLLNIKIPTTMIGSELRISSVNG
ncbi:MAG: hypothetical protein ACI86C_001893, partial [Candidatus Latescibacterota bacterium]